MSQLLTFSQNSDVGWEKGKWYNAFDHGHPQIPTNVTRLARAIIPEAHDQKPQIVYYQAGVGSGWSVTDSLLGGGLAMGLSENVREAYGYLAHNFMAANSTKNRPFDDEIYLMGFSRGAFTARSVGGMLGSIGLLKKDTMKYFYAVFEDFQGAGSPGHVCKLTEANSKFVITEDSKDATKYLAAYKKTLLDVSSRPLGEKWVIGFLTES
jgi:hypothetical protein